MSGIAAVFDRVGNPIDLQALEVMLAASQYQAVDGCGIWHNDHISLAHQHFWITPEEQGEEQPAIFNDGQYAITFDGRLDNRRQLLERLDLRDPVRTLTDAELTLQAYVRWGHACVQYLLGDFAFLIWDHPEQHLFIARDPLGVRQVCYFVDDKRCVVASTVGQVLAHPEVRMGLNEATIAEYLVGYTANQRESHYEGIYFCPPGHCVLLSADHQQEWRHWYPDLARQIRYRDDREYFEGFYALFREAVHDRLRFVGKMGIALSGGMDSTSVTAIAHEALRTQGRLPSGGLNTYSYTFDKVHECDERQYFQPLVERYGLHSTLIDCDNVAILAGSELPMFSSDYILNMGGTYLPWTLLQEMSQDGCRVQLTGGFGDMLFQRQFGWYWAMDLVRDGRWTQFRNDMRESGAGRNGWFSLAKSTIYSYLPSDWKSSYRRRGSAKRWQHTGISTAFVEQVNLADRIAAVDFGQQRSLPGVAQQFGLCYWSSYVRLKAIINDWATRLGIEIWEPFRDGRLVEYVLALPAYIQGLPQMRKLILRQAMAEHLPDEIVNRVGKTAVNPWIADRFWQGEWASAQEVLFRDPRIVADGYVRREWLEERLQIQMSHPGEDQALWRVLVLEKWLRQFA